MRQRILTSSINNIKKAGGQLFHHEVLKALQTPTPHDLPVVP